MPDDALPDPLVPPEVDLRGMSWMPYYGDNLLRSDLNVRISDCGYRAAHNLWWAAWCSMPAGSLPDDDVALARYADLGRDIRHFRKVKDEALHGFIKCSDGRLYHRFLAPLAIEAWERRKKERDRKRSWRNRERGQDGAVTGTDPTEGLGQDRGQDGAVPDERKGKDRTGQEERKRRSQESESRSEKPESVAARGLQNGRDLGRSAPSGADATAAEKAEIDALVSRAVATLNGSAPKGIIDPEARSAAIKVSKFHKFIHNLNAWAATHLDGNERSAAWDTIAAAEAAGERKAMPGEVRRKLDELDKQFRASSVQSVVDHAAE